MNCFLQKISVSAEHFKAQPQRKSTVFLATFNFDYVLLHPANIGRLQWTWCPELIHVRLHHKTKITSWSVYNFQVILPHHPALPFPLQPNVITVMFPRGRYHQRLFHNVWCKLLNCDEFFSSSILPQLLRAPQLVQEWRRLWKSSTLGFLDGSQ